MTAVHVIMMVRNEMGRYLSKSLKSAQAVAEAGGGHLFVTDDASTDATVDVVRNYTSLVQETDEPLFWKHEGLARQRHLDFAAQWIQDGDWILSLDADETINKPEWVAEIVKKAGPLDDSVGIPLYEFWSPTQYRIDGFWFGTMSSRLFRFRPGGKMADKEMASGSEPTYVADSVFAGRWVKQTGVHLLHWGYLKVSDRERKYLAYSQRAGGNGHHSKHVASIIDSNPTLRTYQG